MKRSGSSPPNSLSSNRPANCVNTSASSLLSPATRSWNTKGISITRSGAGRTERQVEQDLEPLAGEPGRQRLEQRARQHEEAAHGIGEPHRQEELRQSDAAIRQHMAPATGEAGVVGARHVPAADGDVVLAAPQCRQHVGQLRLVVLEVAVDHRHVLRRGGQRALDHRRGQAAAADAADAADAPIGLGNAADLGGGAVRAVVVDVHHLPGDAVQRGVQPGDQRRDIGTLIVTGDDDSQHRRAASDAAGVDLRGERNRTCPALCHEVVATAEPPPDGGWCGSSATSARG